MPNNQGPLTWLVAPFMRPPTFAGIALSGCLASIRIDPVEAGIALPMLDGGRVFQVEPLPANASLARAEQEITLAYAAATEEDSRLADMLAALCRQDPQPIVIWDVISDYWRIGAEARTTWPLSRGSAPTPPSVHSGEIIAADGSRTALTLVGGAPGSGDIMIADGVATTADLSAQAGGIVEVRYYPIRMIGGVTRSQDSSETGLMSFELTLREWLP